MALVGVHRQIIPFRAVKLSVPSRDSIAVFIKHGEVTEALPLSTA